MSDKFEKPYMDEAFKTPDPWRLASSPYEQQKYRRQINVAQDRAPNARRILEVGCAEGAHTSMIADAWPVSEVLGIDVSGVAIERAKEHVHSHPNVEVRVMDAVKFFTKRDEEKDAGQGEHSPSVFDLCFWSESIYYLYARLEDHRFTEVIGGLAERLRKGGVLVMANIHNQPAGDEKKLTTQTRMDTIRQKVGETLSLVARARYREWKPESGRAYDYEIWTFLKPEGRAQQWSAAIPPEAERPGD